MSRLFTSCFVTLLFWASLMTVRAQERLEFVFITCCVDEDFFDPVKKGMNDAAELMNVSVEFIGTSDVDIPAQVAMVRDAVEEGYDGIALNIIDPVAFDKAVDHAMQHGVPVVAFNVDDTTPNARLSAVGQDYYRAGLSLGAKVRDRIPPESTVLVTLHSEGVSSLTDRFRGLRDALGDRDITWETVVTGIYSEEASAIITDRLREHPEIQAILATGQADTEGAGLAVARSFKDRGYLVAGFDLSTEILRLISDDVIQYTIDQQPYIQGFYPVVQLAQYIRYGLKPADLDSGAAIVSKESVSEVLELVRDGYR